MPESPVFKTGEWLNILIFSHFSYALDPPLNIGELREITVNESMSACNRKYQEEATGTSNDKGYAVGVSKKFSRTAYVKFDGYNQATSTLKDAKGFGYKVKSDGSWSTTKTGNKMQEKLIAQAKRQERAAEAAGIQSIEWLLAEEKYLGAFQEILREAGTSRITLKYVAPSEEAKKLCKKKSESAASSH
jgi:hypothetical protein